MKTAFTFPKYFQAGPSLKRFWRKSSRAGGAYSELLLLSLMGLSFNPALKP